MAKGVEAHGRGVDFPEFFGKIGAAQLHLADQRFPAGHVAIGLQVPSAHDVPLSGLDQGLNAPEQLGLIFLHPAIEQGFIVAEYKIVELLAEIRRRPETGNRGSRALFPLPLPDRVDMGVANQMNFSH